MPGKTALSKLLLVSRRPALPHRRLDTGALKSAGQQPLKYVCEQSCWATHCGLLMPVLDLPVMLPCTLQGARHSTLFQ